LCGTVPYHIPQDNIFRIILLSLLISDLIYEHVCYSTTIGETQVDGRIILGGIFRKWEGIVGTGWSGLRIGTGVGHL
jgi:hypothetical protein